MDRIFFRCILPGEPGSEHMRPNAVRVSVQVNDQEPCGDLVDTAGILFGGAARLSSFYVYTCSCGCSGCAGFHLPLDQRRSDGVVTWTIEDKKLAEMLGASTLTFDAEDYDAARQSLLQDLTALEAKGFHAESFFHGDAEDDYYEDDEEDDESDDLVEEEDEASVADDRPTLQVAETLDALAAYWLPYYHGQTEMMEAIEAAEGPGAPCMLRFSWAPGHVSFKDGTVFPEQFHPMSAANVAARLLNIGESATPANRPRVEVLSEVASIIREFAASKDAIAAETAFLPYRRFLDEDGVDETQPYFHTDLTGPFVRFP